MRAALNLALTVGYLLGLAAVWTALTGLALRHLDPRAAALGVLAGFAWWALVAAAGRRANRGPAAAAATFATRAPDPSDTRT